MRLNDLWCGTSVRTRGALEFITQPLSVEICTRECWLRAQPPAGDASQDLPFWGFIQTGAPAISTIELPLWLLEKELPTCIQAPQDSVHLSSTLPVNSWGLFVVAIANQDNDLIALKLMGGQQRSGDSSFDGLVQDNRGKIRIARNEASLAVEDKPKIGVRPDLTPVLRRPGACPASLSRCLVADCRHESGLRTR